MIVDRIDSLAPVCAFCGGELLETEAMQARMRTELPWMFAVRKIELRAHPRCLLMALHHRWQTVLGDEPERRPV